MKTTDLLDAKAVLNTTVTVKDAVTFSRSGVVVGRLDATYDFKNLDPELQDYALMVIARGTNLALPVWAAPSVRPGGGTHPGQIDYVLRAPAKRPWWKRLVRSLYPGAFT